MVLLIALQWLVAWSLRFVPTTIKTEAMKTVAWLSVSAAWFSTFMIEIFVYRSMTGIRDLNRDGFFTSVFITEGTVSLYILFKSAQALQQKRTEQREEKANCCQVLTNGIFAN